MENESDRDESLPSPAGSILKKEKLILALEKSRNKKSKIKTVKTGLFCHFCEKSINENLWFKCIYHKNYFCMECITKTGEFNASDFVRCKEQLDDKKDCIFEKYFEGENLSKKYKLQYPQ
jgi:hypothetical protein